MNKMISRVYNAPTKAEGTFNGYLIGFILSLILTISAYFLTIKHSLSRNLLVVLIAVFAISQFFIQLIFFLHLFKDSKPRYRLLVFVFMICIVLILVGGSLWIMTNLNYDTSLSHEIQYMNNQGGGL